MENTVEYNEDKILFFSISLYAITTNKSPVKL